MFCDLVTSVISTIYEDMYTVVRAFDIEHANMLSAICTSRNSGVLSINKALDKGQAVRQRFGCSIVCYSITQCHVPFRSCSRGCSVNIRIFSSFLFHLLLLWCFRQWCLLFIFFVASRDQWLVSECVVLVPPCRWLQCICTLAWCS